MSWLLGLIKSAWNFFFGKALRSISTHLRGGHWRMQPIGPGRSLAHKVWIPDVLVKA